MQINLIRNHFTDNVTFGELTIEGDDFGCYTLEDKDRRISNDDNIERIKEIKVYGKTAIPYGTYEIAVTYSNKFKKYLPLLLNVKGFEGIRIHTGNFEADTYGCILVGKQKNIVSEAVLNSRPAFAELFMLIQERIQTEKVFITISNINAV